MVLLAAFLGGAVPWLEAIIVIPVGIVAGGAPVAVVAAALAGNLLTLWLATVFGARMRTWWSRRAEVKHARRGEVEPSDGAARRQGRAERIDRVMRRWGMPGLAILGPLGLGTHVSAVAAVAVGVSVRAAFAWVAAGTVAWSVIAAVLTVAGVSFLGVGA